MCQLGREVTEDQAGHDAGPDTIPLWSQRLAEAERLRGAETAARLEHHQQHAECWMKMELLQQQLKVSQEKVSVIQLVTGWLLSGPCDVGIAQLGAVLDTFPRQKRVSSSFCGGQRTHPPTQIHLKQVQVQLGISSYLQLALWCFLWPHPVQAGWAEEMEAE